LKREEYVAQLAKSDIILLPYDPVAYYARTSGLFVEAICAGKVVFTREGSWLAHELHRYDLHELITDFASLEHMISIAQDAEVLKKLARMQQAYQKFHSVENFAQTISAILA